MGGSATKIEKLRVFFGRAIKENRQLLSENRPRADGVERLCDCALELAVAKDEVAERDGVVLECVDEVPDGLFELFGGLVQCVQWAALPGVDAGGE
jgi:hypothetical protein